MNGILRLTVTHLPHPKQWNVHEEFTFIRSMNLCMMSCCYNRRSDSQSSSVSLFRIVGLSACAIVLQGGSDAKPPSELQGRLSGRHAAVAHAWRFRARCTITHSHVDRLGINSLPRTPSGHRAVSG